MKTKSAENFASSKKSRTFAARNVELYQVTINK